MNADPRHRFRPKDIADLNVASVRYPYRYGRDYRRFAAGLAEHEIDVLLIATNESFTKRELAEQDWVPGLRRIARHYPDLTAIQLGNESDGTGDSSWHMEPVALSGLFRAGRVVWPIGSGVTLVGAGMVSGDPAYLDGVAYAPIDALAVHPYAQDANTVGALLDLYRRFNLPIWCTEVGAEHGAFNNEHERGEWHSNMIRTLANYGVEYCSVFCWSDRMEPSFGLVDGRGRPYESFAAVANAS